MDRSADWPWSWEEEVEWRAALEETDSDFTQELIENAVADGATDILNVLALAHEQATKGATPEEYLVTA